MVDTQQQQQQKLSCACECKKNDEIFFIKTENISLFRP